MPALRPAPPRSPSLGALAAVLLLAACGGEARTGDADLQVTWSFEPSPPRVGTAQVRLEVTDVDWTPRNGATVVVTGLRDGVELVVDTARGEGAGRYVAPAFRFEVAGAWVLRARVETTDRRWMEVERPVTVEAGGS
ncbi:MAG: hypothetical protein ACYC6F_04540 [Longimicrobiales bacterium]